VGTSETPERTGKFTINMLGEYNIGGDAFEIDRILEKCGITVNATFSGNSTYNDFASAQMADLSCVMCHRSINYVADMLETKYGIPWIKVNFIGAHATAKSLRRIAQHFGDTDLIKRVEEVIAEEMPVVEAALAEIKPRTTGKTAMLFVGGSRAHHYQELFHELGMTTLAAGYEFGHRDDYEGRQVIPTIKVDADSRNIEELHVEADPEKYSPRLTEAEIKAREEAGLKFKEYDGLITDMPKKTMIIDDLNQFESERLIEMYKPDIFCAGIKEKYVISKSGVPCKQLHNYDMGGPYTCFQGAINFYEDVDKLVNTTAWKLIKAPWQKADGIEASFAR
jgi:nitrogenase molybdenum-iron protein alpha chain